jgi:hypothetical protein
MQRERKGKDGEREKQQIVIADDEAGGGTVEGQRFFSHSLAMRRQAVRTTIPADWPFNTIRFRVAETVAGRENSQKLSGKSCDDDDSDLYCCWVFWNWFLDWFFDFDRQGDSFALPSCRQLITWTMASRSARS